MVHADRNSGELARFIAKIADHPVLTRKQEYELAMQVKKNVPGAVDKLMASNYRLVISVAKHYLGRGLSLDELIQEGAIGLQKGVQKFEAGKGNRLATYAVWWIRAYITRAIKNEQERQRRFCASVDANIDGSDDADGVDFHSVLPSDSRNPLEEFERNETFTDVAGVLIRYLRPVERAVIHCRFYRELTLEQTAVAIASSTNGKVVSRERVRQLEKQTMKKLKRVLTETGLFE